jgi:hypothetical protein
MITPILTTIIVPFLRYQLNVKIKRIRELLEGEITDTFLELLLCAMSLLFKIDKNFRKNIEGFSAVYVFKDRSGTLAATAIFSNGRMTIKRKEVSGAVVTVVFDRGKSLCDLLFSNDPNIFDFLLENRLTYSGNLNYLLKFAFLAKHLKLKFSF